MTRQERHGAGTSARAGRPLRVVVADDDLFFREVLVATLEADPRLSVVDEAGDGHEAVSLVSEHTPDVVLLDLAMPHLDGIEAAREVRRSHPRVGILMCSGDRSRRRDALLAGVDRWVDKPADRRTLVDALLDLADHGELASGRGARHRRGREPGERRFVDRVHHERAAGGAEIAE